MATTDELFNSVTRGHDSFVRWCRPLEKYFGVGKIAYIEINSGGELLNLHNSLEWIDRCMQEKYYANDPHMVDPNNITSGFAYAESYGPGVYADTMLKDAVCNFDMHKICSYAMKDKNVYKLLSISAPEKHNKFASKIAMEFPLLKKMIWELFARIDQDNEVRKNLIDFKDLRGDSFYKQRGIIYEDRETTDHKITLLNELHLADDNILQTKLSNQERKCLRLYLARNSVKQIAKILNLSEHTITSYIENTKSKLSCNYKDELLNKAEVLDCLGKL